MKTVSDILLSNPQTLLMWGYEFPVLTEFSFSFKVKCNSYTGGITIQKDTIGYSIFFLSCNEIISGLTAEKVFQVLYSKLDGSKFDI